MDSAHIFLFILIIIMVLGVTVGSICLKVEIDDIKRQIKGGA